MLKLYRTIDGLKEYWEAWEDSRKKVVVHWGKLGERGENRTVSVKNGSTPSKVILHEAKEPLATGFKEIPNDALTQMVIQHRIDDMGTRKDLDRHHEIENRMNECLGWTGLGHCDGGDIGSGTMNVFCFVADTTIATRVIIEDLRAGNLLDGALIAARYGEERKVLWPESFSGRFSIM